jgi:transposase
MGTARRQNPAEFKREAIGLLASSGRPLRQIAQEPGIAASRLRAWREAGDRRNAGSPRPNTQAAIPSAGAELAAENGRLRRENERPRMEREILKRTPRIFPAAPERNSRLRTKAVMRTRPICLDSLQHRIGKESPGTRLDFF